MDVFYVAPNGVAMTKEQKERLEKHADEMAKFVVQAGKVAFKVLSEVVTVVADVVGKVVDFLKEIDCEAIKKRIDNEKKMRRSWHVPRNTMKAHQVLDRTPVVTHIRNHI